MSPLSVSTYLDSKMSFDIVIFDEASQVFPWDAIGAIYRAKQAIIVGDPKQMPPSNFFLSLDADDSFDNEDLVNVDAYESILDFFSSYPTLSLNWHYRSKCEDLISFSNKEFYNSSLITFPSAIPSQNKFGVDFKFVPNSILQNGENIKEAKVVAKQVYQHYLENPERSLGVVVFNIKQQALIEDYVDEISAKDDDFSHWLISNKDEPFFIKNLENVQGDERDSIILSIGYAKQLDGRLMMNFGPLNRDGGERRLNVAITRAKYNVLVVSSIHYYDLDLSRTNSSGAKLLCEYLRFAETHHNVSQITTFSFGSSFEQDVYDFLVSNGYIMDAMIGTSSFHIDLAVKHPATKNYVLAIESDGINYHSALTTRDRDRLRQEILEKQGWHFYRLWSVDWFKNQEEEKQKLIENVNLAIESSKNQEMPTAEQTNVNCEVSNSKVIYETAIKEMNTFADNLPDY